MNNNLIIIFFLYVFNVIHLCQSEDKYYLYNTHQINLLPPNIPLIVDKVYLWADTNKIEGNTIQVLLINNSENELKFNGYQLSRIQPEYKINSENWVRFVPFFYGWCGTAFAYDITIPSKEFYVSKESFRSGIVKSEIRFNFFGNDILSSNSFFASIDTSEVELAKYDDITYMYCDLNYLVRILEEMPKPYKEIPNSQKYLHTINRDSLFIKLFNDGIVLRAMDVLVERFPDEIFTVLEPIAESKNHPYKDSASRIVNAIKNKNN